MLFYTWVIPLAITAASMIYDYYNKPKNKAVDPASMKDELTYSEKDVQKDLGTYTKQLKKVASSNIAKTQRYGSAHRLPEGAILSAAKDTMSEVEPMARNILPSLRGKKLGSQQRYFGLLNQFHQGQMNYDYANLNRTQQGIGTLGNIATLYSAGYLN